LKQMFSLSRYARGISYPFVMVLINYLKV